MVCVISIWTFIFVVRFVGVGSGYLGWGSW